MSEKHKYWMFKFEDQVCIFSMSINLGEPVTEEEILEHLQDRYGTETTIFVWPSSYSPPR